MRRESGALNREVARSFPADAAALRDVREFVRARAGEHGVPKHELADLLIAVSEACTNVVRHASATEMKLRWRVEGDRVEIEVEDSGVFLDRPFDPTRAGGFGVPLMRSLMDEVLILRGDRGHPGTRVLLVKRIPDRAGTAPAPRRGGLRTRHLHAGSPVRERPSSRRRPLPNLVGLGAAATLVALAAVIGTLAILHNSHLGTALASGRSPGATHPAHRSAGGRPVGTAANHGKAHPMHRTAPRSKPSPPSHPTTSHEPVTLPAVACPGTALLGVYAPLRLDVLSTCRWVRGRVVAVHKQHDGNQRITITTPNGRRLVLEIVLGQSLPAPGVGELVAAFGTLVRDRAAGWTGIEPAWAIDYIDRGEVWRVLPPSTPLFSGGNAVCVPSAATVCASLPAPVPSVSVPVSVPSIP